MFEIVDIDIRMDYQNFSDLMDEVVKDETSNTGISFDWSSKESHLNRSNTSMYKITFTNLDSGSTIDIVAEKSNNDIVFKPISLRNYNESFYKCDYNDDSLFNTTLLALKKSALKAKGSFGCTMDGRMTLVKDGRDISTHAIGLAIVDDKGKVYHLKHSQNIDIEDEDGDGVTTYVPNYLINNWLEENPQFQAKLQSVPKTDRFELMAQFAIYQKKKDMITADQFRDVLMQVGTFAEMVGGFKDELVKNIYQLFI